MNRGGSRQDWQTPPVLLAAIRDHFRIAEFSLDAAASPLNAVAPTFYTEADNGLIQPWTSWTWCNPPFSTIGPWAEKAWDETYLGVSSMLLLPASVGSNWWKDYVDGKAHVVFLNGRITFVGATTPYPKDCALLIYNPQIRGGYSIWTWR